MTNTEKFIIAAATDAVIEDSITKEFKLQKELMNDLIGKQYVPQDNSYISEIIRGERMNYHCSLIGVPCKIITRPYITEVKTFAKDKRVRMIKVQSLKTGLIYEVLFAESWIRD